MKPKDSQKNRRGTHCGTRQSDRLKKSSIPVMKLDIIYSQSTVKKKGARSIGVVEKSQQTPEKNISSICKKTDVKKSQQTPQKNISSSCKKTDVKKLQQTSQKNTLSSCNVKTDIKKSQALRKNISDSCKKIKSNFSKSSTKLPINNEGKKTPSNSTLVLPKIKKTPSSRVTSTVDSQSIIHTDKSEILDLQNSTLSKPNDDKCFKRAILDEQIKEVECEKMNNEAVRSWINNLLDGSSVKNRSTYIENTPSSSMTISDCKQTNQKTSKRKIKKKEVDDLCSLINNCQLVSQGAENNNANTRAVPCSNVQNSRNIFANSIKQRNLLNFTSNISFVSTSENFDMARDFVQPLDVKDYSSDLDIKSILKQVTKIKRGCPSYVPFTDDWYEGFDLWTS